MMTVLIKFNVLHGLIVKMQTEKSNHYAISVYYAKIIQLNHVENKICLLQIIPKDYVSQMIIYLWE